MVTLYSTAPSPSTCDSASRGALPLHIHMGELYARLNTFRRPSRHVFPTYRRTFPFSCDLNNPPRHLHHLHSDLTAGY